MIGMMCEEHSWPAHARLPVQREHRMARYSHLALLLQEVFYLAGSPDNEMVPDDGVGHNTLSARSAG